MSVWIPEGTDLIKITNCYTYCDICGENLAGKYFVKFQKYKEMSKLRHYIGISIIDVCNKCLEKVS